MKLQSFVAIVIMCGFVANASAEDWAGWRGPTGMGQSPAKELPLTWGGKENRNVLWKVPLPGTELRAGTDQNQSSPIVSHGRVFVTVSYWPDKVNANEYPEHHVACYRARDGKQLWDVPIPPGPWKFGDLRGGYTAPTPAADGERVYVVFGSAVMAALNFDGTIVWRKEITPYKFDVAYAGSPVLFEDTLLLQFDQTDKAGSRLSAFDRKTGEIKWSEKRPKASFSHSTPTLAAIDGRTQLLVAGSSELQGVDPTNGKVLWTADAKGDTVSPVFGGGLVYTDSGRGGPGLAVDPTGTGDVTKTHVKWKLATVPEGYSSPVIVGDYLYRVCNPEVLRCYKLTTGESIYTERLAGLTAAVSPIATGDERIYLASSGKSYVLKAGPKPEILGTSDLGDPSHASAAVADGKLFVKGKQFLFCIGTKP